MENSENSFEDGMSEASTQYSQQICQKHQSMNYNDIRRELREIKEIAENNYRQYVRNYKQSIEETNKRIDNLVNVIEIKEKQQILEIFRNQKKAQCVDNNKQAENIYKKNTKSNQKIKNYQAQDSYLIQKQHFENDTQDQNIDSRYTQDNDTKINNNLIQQNKKQKQAHQKQEKRAEASNLYQKFVQKKKNFQDKVRIQDQKSFKTIFKQFSQIKEHNFVKLYKSNQSLLYQFDNHAIKKLDYGKADKQKVENEISIYERLSSQEYVPEFLGVVEDNGIYLVTQRILGGNIEELLQQGVDIDKQYFDALENYINDMHSKGVTHQDLKPKNILIDPKSKKIYIIDFGQSIQYFKGEIDLKPQETTPPFLHYQRFRSARKYSFEDLKYFDKYQLGLIILYAIDKKITFEIKYCKVQYGVGKQYVTEQFDYKLNQDEQNQQIHDKWSYIGNEGYVKVVIEELHPKLDKLKSIFKKEDMLIV